MSRPTPLHVTVPAWRPSRPGLRFRQAALPADEITDLDGLPVTTAFRTLLDLAADLDERRLEAALAEAEALALTEAVPLGALIDRHACAPGRAKLRRLLESTPARTRSELERAFLAFLAEHGLPRPDTNVWLDLGGPGLREADCVWPAQRVIVELDGWAFHRGRDAFEADRAKDLAASGAGWRTVRVTRRAIDAEPARLALGLAAMLGSRCR